MTAMPMDPAEEKERKMKQNLILQATDAKDRRKTVDAMLTELHHRSGEMAPAEVEKKLRTPWARRFYRRLLKVSELVCC